VRKPHATSPHWVALVEARKTGAARGHIPLLASVPAIRSIC
jgi:hypothetical protein